MRIDTKINTSLLQERNGQALRVNIPAPYGG